MYDLLGLGFIRRVSIMSRMGLNVLRANEEARTSHSLRPRNRHDIFVNDRDYYDEHFSLQLS